LEIVAMVEETFVCDCQTSLDTNLNSFACFFCYVPYTIGFKSETHLYSPFLYCPHNKGKTM